MGAAVEQLKKLFFGLLRVQPGEGRRVALMFGILLCVVGAFIVGRVARDSLFLSRYPVSSLPYQYIWVALGVCIQSYLYSRVADRFRRDRTFAVSLTATLVVTLGARLALLWVGDWFYPVLYVFVELFGSLLIIQAWTLANDVFTTREAKRLFGLIGAGAVVSSVLVGFSVRGAVGLFGTENLLLLCAGSLAIALYLLYRLSSTCRDEIATTVASRELGKRAKISFFTDWGRIFASRHLILVASLMVLLAFVMTFIDFRFKIAARAAYPGDEGRLAEYFGLFYGITGALSCVVQFLFTGRILERFGILVSLLLLPVTLLVGTVSLLLSPALWSASLLKGGDAVLRYTVNDATMQFLYLPVPSWLRGRAKAFIDGIVRPLAIGLSGGALAWVLPHLPADALGWIVLSLLLLWAGTAFGMRRQYLASLMNTMMSRRLQADDVGSIIPDEAAGRVLRRALQDPNEDNVLYALEMTRACPNVDWAEDLVRLAAHPSSQVRAQALHRLGESGSLERGPVVAAGLKDKSPLVLAAAVEAYCAIGKQRAIRAVQRFLDHPDLAVRSAAVVGLIRYGGLDGVLSSAERLKTMLESEKKEERAAGARILGEIGVKNFYHPLLALLTDPEVEVRMAAARAAGQVQSAELLPALVYRLEDPQVRPVAAEALVAFGPGAVKLLQRVLGNNEEAEATRLSIPAVLARIGDQAALNALLLHLADHHEGLRSRVLDAIHWLRLHRPHLDLPRQASRQAALAEIEVLYQQLQTEWDLNLTESSSLLADALEYRRAKTMHRIFRLLGCFLPPRSMDAVQLNLGSLLRQARANAIEALDNLLDKELKRLLLPVLGDATGQTPQEIARELGTQALGRERRLCVLMAEPDAWLSCCALYTAGELKVRALAPDVLLGTASEDPLVRETALSALHRLMAPVDMVPTANRHLKDPSPKVRAYASWLIEAARAPAT